MVLNFHLGRSFCVPPGTKRGPDQSPVDGHLRPVAKLILQTKRPCDARFRAFTTAISAPQPSRERVAVRAQKGRKRRHQNGIAVKYNRLLGVVQLSATTPPVSFVTRELRPKGRRDDPIALRSDGSISSSAATSASRKPSCSSSESATLRASLACDTAASASVLSASAFPASRISVSSRTRRSCSRPAIPRRV